MRRLLRVLEYQGTDEFIEDAINRRGVKGTHLVSAKGLIREAIIGETSTLLDGESTALLLAQLAPLEEVAK